MPLFDAYIFIDWSAAMRVQPVQPRANAVWVGELVPRIEYKHESYHRTRNDGIKRVTKSLMEHATEGRRVLIGFDFPYGYPAGFVRAMRLPFGPHPWRAVWEELGRRITDTVHNVNNRFAAAADLNTILSNSNSGPFWGRPPAMAIENLQPHSPAFPFHAACDVLLQQLREVEGRVPRTQATWKLFGAGSVGSQTLVGIPYVKRLRFNADLEKVSKVWPFETQFTPTPTPCNGPFILHAEIWPGVVEQQVQDLMVRDPPLIRDQAQVRAMCEWAKKCDNEGTFGKFFDTPHDLDQQHIRVCTQEEGWILGVT